MLFLDQKRRPVKTGFSGIPRTEMCSMQEVLAYENEEVVKRIGREMKKSKEEAQAIFKDTIRFLYMCGAHYNKRPFYPPPLIDEAWHTFLLFTKDYATFCNEKFGWFINHAPMTAQMQKARAESGKQNATFDIAQQIFGELSLNWAKADAECGNDGCEQSCAPDHD